MKPPYKFISLEIKNMYTKIPIRETLKILEDNLKENKKMNNREIDELINLTKTLLKQNYFTFDKKFFFQESGLAMGSPISGLLADIYFNHFENSYIFNNNPFQKNIIFYKRYVDDIFIIFNGSTRQAELLKNHINTINEDI